MPTFFFEMCFLLLDYIVNGMKNQIFTLKTFYHCSSSGNLQFGKQNIREYNVFNCKYKERRVIKLITDEFVEKSLELLKNRYEYLKNNNISFHIHKEKPNRNKGTHSHIKSFYNRERKENYFEIHLNISGQEEKSKMLRKRFEPFLESRGLKLDKEVGFIMKALHEIGHLDMYVTLMKTYKKDLRTIQNYLTMERSALGVLFNSDNDADAFLRGENLRYSFSMVELYADNFALKNFNVIWSEIIYIIKNESVEDSYSIQF